MGYNTHWVSPLGELSCCKNSRDHLPLVNVSGPSSQTGGDAGWWGLSCAHANPREQRQGLLLPGPVETVPLPLVASQQPAPRVDSQSARSFLMLGGGCGHPSWVKRCSQRCGSGVQLCPAFEAALPASELEPPAQAPGSSGVRMKRRDAGAVLPWVLSSVLVQTPITGLPQGVHLFSRRPPTHIQGPSTTAFPDVGDALSSHLISCPNSAPAHP